MRNWFGMRNDRTRDAECSYAARTRRFRIPKSALRHSRSADNQLVAQHEAGGVPRAGVDVLDAAQVRSGRSAGPCRRGRWRGTPSRPAARRSSPGSSRAGCRSGSSPRPSPACSTPATSARPWCRTARPAGRRRPTAIGRNRNGPLPSAGADRVGPAVHQRREHRLAHHPRRRGVHRVRQLRLHQRHVLRPRTCRRSPPIVLAVCVRDAASR